MSNPTIINWCPNDACDPCGCLLVTAEKTHTELDGDTLTFTFGIPSSIAGKTLCDPSGQMNIPDGYTINFAPVVFGASTITVSGPGLSGNNSGGGYSVPLSVPDPLVSLGPTFTIVVTSTTGFAAIFPIPALHEYRYIP